MKYLHGDDEIKKNRLNKKLPIWQIVSKTLEDPSVIPWQLNKSVPVGVREGYSPYAVQASNEEIFDYLVFNRNRNNEVTVLEHHLENNSKKTSFGSDIAHRSLILNNNLIDPLRLTIDLDVFKKKLGGVKVENYVDRFIDKVCQVLSDENIEVSRNDFIVLTSGYNKIKDKFGYHIILSKANFFCKNQYSFLKILKKIKNKSIFVDKMFPGFITRTYASGKYPMGQSKDRVFKVCKKTTGYKIDDFESEFEFFERTLMYNTIQKFENITIF